ncbi:MAG: flagellar basal body P-ring formation chaperone FlgA [Roseinatronobacter sp.]
MRALVMLMALAAPVQADTLVATRLIRAATVIGPDDVAPGPSAVIGAARDAAQVVGLEARVAIYPGRPVRLADLGPAAAVERNEIVQLVFRRGALSIVTEGRALARGAIDDVVPVMNLASRTTVQGVIRYPGLIEVTPDRSR